MEIGIRGRLRRGRESERKVKRCKSERKGGVKERIERESKNIFNFPMVLIKQKIQQQEQ